MRRYIAYTRVSTAKQGEKGSSLVEQKSIIESYARREGLAISAWYEERVTAAKVGRTIFKQMMQVFARGGAEGLILHKIDRGARNLKDWALLSELTDTGVDVRIAGDSIDMNSRGGRLSADIQAVVAADYIRNLREEVKKGQQGRLKAGLYPWSAPIGYINTGKGGRAKEICSEKGPLVRRAFIEYAAGKYTLRTLALALSEWGIKSRGGRPLSLSRVNEMLRRKFYIGLLEVKGETFAGAHDPLVTKELFDQVQAVLNGRSAERLYGENSYLFKRLIRCAACERFLYAETQKGRRYYRCHTEGCSGSCIGEARVVDRVIGEIALLFASDHLLQACSLYVEQKKLDVGARAAELKAGTSLRLSRVVDQISRLTDAYLDRALEREEYDIRKRLLLEEKIALQERLRESDQLEETYTRAAKLFFELITGLKGIVISENTEEIRRIFIASISNLLVAQKVITLQWRKSVLLLIEACSDLNSAHAREGYRTFEVDDAVRDRARIVMEEVFRESLSPPPMSGSPDVRKPQSE